MEKLLPILYFTLFFIPSKSFCQMTPFNIYNKPKEKTTTTILEQSGNQGRTTTTTNVKTRDLEAYIFGTGGIRNSFTSENGEDNSPVGSLGISFCKNEKIDFIIGFSVNDFNTTDIANEEVFATALLIPDLSGRSFTASYSRLYDKLKKGALGFRAEAQIATSKWSINGREYNASPFLFRASANYLPFGILDDGKNKVVVEITTGVSLRSLVGDLSNNREALSTINVSDTSFSGFEIGAALILNKTRLFLNIPILGGTDTKGITGPQVMIGVTAAANATKLF